MVLIVEIREVWSQWLSTTDNDIHHRRCQESLRGDVTNITNKFQAERRIWH